MKTKIIKKVYLPVKGKENHYLKCECYYSLGGLNAFTYKNEERGYYLSVSPVEKDGIMESYVAFSGTKILLVKATRQSKQKEEAAAARFDAEYLDWSERLFPNVEVTATSVPA